MLRNPAAKLLVLTLAVLFGTTSSEAQRNLSKPWQDNYYPRIRTYPNHTSLGPNYAADFYFTSRNHADLYLNGETPLADGLPEIPVISANGGSAYLLLYDMSNFSGGNYSSINAQRVINGLDSVPHNSFSFDDSLGTTRKIDMEFVADSLTWRSLYAHLKIDESYFNQAGVEQAIKNAIYDFWSNSPTTSTCSSVPRIAINLQTTLSEGSLIGGTNKWGLAQDEHLHFQIFTGSAFPPCLGTPCNLSDSTIDVTLNSQIIIDSDLEVGVPGCDGGTCFYYPAMERQIFLQNQSIRVSASWDSISSVELRETPGGTVNAALANETPGTVISGPTVANLPDSTYHVWWKCRFGTSIGWIPAEYIAKRNQAITSVVAWGRNIYGQCNAPTDSDFVAVAAGHGHSFGLRVTRTIAAWGLNDNDQCNIPSPNNEFTKIAGGSGYSMGLKTNGSIVAWGSNVEEECNIPLPNSNFIAIAGGGAHGLGLKNDGSIVTWGNNIYGQCNVPIPNADFISVAAGNIHSLGLKADGSIVAWGSNTYGQCNVPNPNADFIAVAAGMGEHSLGLKSDGSVIAWGRNDDGQCDVPQPDTGFVAIAAGQYHSLALKADGSIIVWGAEGGGHNFGQLNVPTPNIDFIAIAAGANHCLGIKLLSNSTGISNPDNRGTQRIFLAMEPNPTSNTINAQFSLPDNSFVQFNLYDVSGRLVSQSTAQAFGPGEHTYILPTQNLANGIYFCVIRTPNESRAKSFTVLR